MSAGQGETDQRLSFAKGVRAAHVVEALHAPVLVGVFGRLYNMRRSLISALIRGQYNISWARRIHPPMPM